MLLLIKLGALVAGVFGQTVSDRTAKLVGGVSLAIALVILAYTGKAIYDRNVIAQHEAAEHAKDVEAALRGEREANQAQAERDKASAEINKKLEQAAEEAAKADPAGASKAVGPTTKAYYDTLRKEKKQ